MLAPLPNHDSAPGDRVRDFVERVGLTWENDGLPRIAGRIFGLLLVTPGACSLDDLADSLGVSKASVSTDARRLEQLGFVERTSRPGDRRDYYTISSDLFVHSLEIRLARLKDFRRLVADAPRPHDAPDVVRRLDALEEVHRLVEVAIEDVLERWKSEAGDDRAN